jgi:hyperosmotically inducible periplasmic protein
MKSRNLKMVLAAVAAMFMITGSLWATEMDAQIVTSVKDTYVFKTFLKDSDIKIDSKEGVVTLTGTVPDDPSRQLAHETAAMIAGVKSVDNKLETKGEVAAENSDGWIHSRVRVMLLTHRNVSAVSTEISVKNGVVTLKGEADSKAQLQLTTEYAKDVDGVKSVKNEMTVAKTPKPKSESVGDKIDDASITAQAKMSVLFHRGTRVLKTEIDTKDGVVTVSGKAKNAAEKELVSKLIADVNGVKEVKNLMVISKS